MRAAPKSDAKVYSISTSKMGKRTSRSDDDDAAKDREAECRGTLRALNAQFAAWVARRAIESPIVSWGKGCEDYLKHVEKIKVRSSRRGVSFCSGEGVRCCFSLSF